VATTVLEKANGNAADDGALHSSSVKVDGTEIRYVEAGSGQPLVYLHGADGLTLSLAHRELSEKYRVIALEIPEFEDAAARNDGPDLPEIASKVNKAIAGLDLDRFSLMGHSLGADLSLWVAIENPEPIDAIILAAPTAIRFGQNSKNGMVKDSAKPNEDNVWFGKAPATPSKAFGKLRDPALEEKMAQLKVPVLALFGTSDSIVSTSAARVYCELLPKCFTMMMYEASHSIDLDRPQAVATVMRNFLENKESFVVNRESGLISP
jgi:pimeloyl-ACP methyl ester carboxylesterase